MANLNFNLILPDRNFSIFLSKNVNSNYNISASVTKENILKCIGNYILDNNIQIPVERRRADPDGKDFKFKYKIYIKYNANTSNNETESNETLTLAEQTLYTFAIDTISTGNIDITNFILNKDILNKEVICEIEVSCKAFYAKLTAKKDFDVIALRPEKDLNFGGTKVGAVFRYSPTSALSDSKFLNFNQNEEFFVIPITEGAGPDNRFRFSNSDRTKYFYYDSSIKINESNTEQYYRYGEAIPPLDYFKGVGCGAASFRYSYIEGADNKNIYGLNKSDWESDSYRDSSFERTDTPDPVYNEVTTYSYSYTRGLVKFQEYNSYQNDSVTLGTTYTVLKNGFASARSEFLVKFNDSYYPIDNWKIVDKISIEPSFEDVAR